MGVTIYWGIVAAVIMFGQIMPQRGNNKKYYIIVMVVLHTFVCGFRYKFLTGDLIRYEADYQDLLYYGWFDEIIRERKNLGFVYFMKFCSELFGGEFQFCLFLIALISEVALAVLIFRYSTKPWISYLVWNCMAFYIFGFSAIKQALAMAIITCAMMCVLEKRLKWFLILVFLAGFIHAPAFCFLPAYWIAERNINMKTILMYIVAGVMIYAFRNPIVEFVTDIYYEEGQIQIVDTTLGGRFFVIVLILICGFLLKGFQDRNFERVFNIIVVAAIFQMFSGFDNVFTRLADYYLQFLVLFIPMIFYESDQQTIQNPRGLPPVLSFNRRSIKILVMLLTLVLVWWYYRTTLSVTISNEVDNYLNFRFFWDVVN